MDEQTPPDAPAGFPATDSVILDQTSDFADSVKVAQIAPADSAGALPEPVTPKPFGWIATALWGLLVYLIAIILQGMAGAVMGILLGMEAGPNVSLEILKNELAELSGFLLAVSILASCPLILGILLLLTSKRRRVGNSYLGFSLVPWRESLRYCGGMLILILAMDTFSYFTHHEIVVEFMTNLYETAGSLPVLWAAVVLGAPLWEEAFFRGFLFRGWEHSWIGPWGAIAVTSMLWAGIHIQYDLYGICQVFVSGSYLGYVRYKTGSTTLTMGLHGLMNTVAMAETVFYLS